MLSIEVLACQCYTLTMAACHHLQYHNEYHYRTEYTRHDVATFHEINFMTKYNTNFAKND